MWMGYVPKSLHVPESMRCDVLLPRHHYLIITSSLPHHHYLVIHYLITVVEVGLP